MYCCSHYSAVQYIHAGLQFFLPLLTGAGLALLAVLVVLCNLATPAIRKSSVLEELSSLSSGLVVVTLLFCLTWSLAPLAYIRLPDLALPDFYPVFQVFILLSFAFAISIFRDAVSL